MAADIKALLKNLGLNDQEVNTISKTTEGLSQQCFIVELAHHSKPLATALNLPAVFVVKMFNYEQGYHNEITALKALSNEKLAPNLLHAERFNNSYYILMEYVSGKSLASSDYSEEDKLSRCLNLMAQFHQAFSYTLAEEKLFPLLKPLDFTTLLQALFSAAKLDTTQKEKLLTISDKLIFQLNNLNLLDDNLVICHGDFNYSNVLISDMKNCIIDFECLSLMPREYDIAMMLAVNELFYVPHEQVITDYLRFHERSKSSVTRLDASLLNLFYQLALLINGLWYLSEYKKNHSSIYSEKANKQLQQLG